MALSNGVRASDGWSLRCNYPSRIPFEWNSLTMETVERSGGLEFVILLMHKGAETKERTREVGKFHNGRVNSKWKILIRKSAILMEGGIFRFLVSFLFSSLLSFLES